MSKVKLLTTGGFCGAEGIVGSIVNAEPKAGGYDILLTELKSVGFVGDGSETKSTLTFWHSEVELLED